MENPETDHALLERLTAALSVNPKSTEYNEQGYLIKLDLSSLHITQLPEELGQLTHLQELSLENNQLTHIPPELGQLAHLQSLLLHQNQLIHIPPELGQLAKLQSLYLYDNQLTHIPPELGQLAQLQSLYLYDNQLTHIPPELGQLAHLQFLRLDNNQLTHIPPELGQLATLQFLRLDNNQLTHIPPELGQLAHLQSLYLYDNQLTHIPPELGQLAHLQSLRLDNNQLTHIPPELGQLTTLQYLYLENNQLTHIPPELGQLATLQYLYLDNNQLTHIPPELGQLATLQFLRLDNNQLTHIPPELGQLATLQFLRLDNNQLTHIPPELGQLATLQDLYLDNNQLTHIPPELGQLATLQYLLLDNNRDLLTPPPEIVAQETQAVLSFLQELHRKHILKYEAKLILVGEGGTGKSSILRACHGKTFEPSLDTTHGIEVDILQLPHPSLPAQSLQLNTWDFGGQEIYRATHQFFLSKRSLYLVVWNARLGGEQGRLDYWLSTIRVLAPDAPVLLVATHIDERLADLNIPQYRADYPQIVEVLQVSNNTGTGINELKQAVGKYAATLKLMGQPWPMSWVEVEQELVANPKHHISAATYTDLCMAKGVHAELAQGSLGGYLHDLGKILYFRDDPILKDIVILKPNWVTKAISCALEDKATRSRYGILEHAELPRIWSADEQNQRYDPALYPLFLRLMERFDLCYPRKANLG